MSVKAGYSTPLLHVAEIERSLKFYELLGFETIDTDRCEPLGWARIHCEGGAIMFLRAEEPMDSRPKDVILYMYTPNLVELREQLLAGGISVAPIRFPPYMPSGEIQLADPDGYPVMIGHWGRNEQEVWERRIGRKV